MTSRHGAGRTRPDRSGPRRRAGVALGVLALVVVLVVAVFATRRPEAPPQVHAEVHTLFGDAVPSIASADDGQDVQVGVTFTSATEGWVSSVRFYQGPLNLGPHDVTLWGPRGEELGRARALASTGGWQEVPLQQPVPIRVGTVYTASYRATQGHYSTGSPSSSVAGPGPHQLLTARRGVYTYGSGMPRDTFEGTYYLVDVAFTTTSPPPSRPSAPESSPEGAPSASPSGDPTPPSRPGASTTGVPPGTETHPYAGPTTITDAGTVIDGADVTGALVVEAKDVVIRRSRIHGARDAAAGLLVAEGGSVLVEDSEIYDVQVGIAGGSWTALRVDIHDTTSDGVKVGSDVRLQDSWIHDGRPGPEAHWDGAQVQSGIERSVVHGNDIDATGSGTNAALFVAPDLGPDSPGPLVVSDNWLDGGNYTLYVLDGADGRFLLTGITVTGNRFGRHAQYGPADVTVPVGWSDNVWEDTGKPLPR